MRSASPTGEKLFGKYAGVVAPGTDLTQSGKLKVIVDDVHGDTAIWASPCVPYAQKDHGFFFLPPAGTPVWVEFQAGDRSRAIWTGCYWKSGEAPSKQPNEMKLSTPSGDIEFDTHKGAGWVKISTKQLSIELSDGTVTITTGGSAKIELDGVTTTVNGGSLEVT